MDELFQKCLFEEDEKEMVLRAIRTVQPNYQLPPPPSPKICKSSLLQDFYSRVSHSAQGGVEAGQVLLGTAQGRARKKKLFNLICAQ